MRGWAYEYHLQINNPNPKIEFLDGEIEEIYWLTIEEINEKIKNKEKITKISIDMFNKFIKKEDQELIVHSKDYGYFNLEVNCNWKFAIENYCESYHLPTIHPELNKVSNINDHYHIQGLPNRFAGQGSKNYQQLIKGNKKSY